MKYLFGENHGLDEKSMDFLSKALEAANLPGFDYIEFRQAIDNLKKMNLDESTAFKSAFATAQTMGLTKEKLIQTAQHYKSVIQKEKEQFDVASQKQQDLKIGANLRETNELQQRVKDNDAKILQLQNEIESARTRIRALDFEREQATSKIEEAKSKFFFTHQSIANQMEQDIASMQKYL